MRLFFILFLSALLASCKTIARDEVKIEFCLEAPLGSEDNSVKIKMPFSDIEFNMIRHPVFTDRDVISIRKVMLEVGPCVLFELREDRMRFLLELGEMYPELKLLLIVNGHVLGFRGLGEILVSGEVLMCLEVNEEGMMYFGNSVMKFKGSMGKKK